jgi:hypothetical protein
MPDEDRRDNAKGGLAGDHQPSYGAAFLLAGVLLAAGLCAATLQANSVPSIFDSHSTPADSIRHLSHFVLGVTGAIFLVVFGLLTYAVVKFRSRAADTEREPAQVYGSTQIELAWTIIPILIVVVLFLATARVIHAIQDAARGSLSWRSFFRYAGGRLRHAVDALLLDIWTSRGLRPDHSVLCIRLRNYSGIFTQADFRIPRHGGRHRLHRFCEHECLAQCMYHCSAQTTSPPGFASSGVPILRLSCSSTLK